MDLRHHPVCADLGFNGPLMNEGQEIILKNCLQPNDSPEYITSASGLSDVFRREFLEFNREENQSVFL